MLKRPKLKVSGLGWDFDGEVLEFEQARLFPYGGGALIVAEGMVVGSYEDLENIVGSGSCKSKLFLEIIFLPIIYGG